MSEEFLRRLVDRADQAEHLRSDFALGPWEDGWCRSSASGLVLSGMLDVQALAELAAVGCRVELLVELERLRVRALAEGSPNFTVEASGEWSDAASDEPQAALAADAASRNDVPAVISALPEVEVRVTMTIVGTQPGVQWVRTAAAFVSEYDQSGWHGFSVLLAPSVGFPNHVVVLDGLDAEVRAAGLAVHGPAQWPRVDAWSIEPEAVADDARSELPLPSALMPREVVGNQLAGIAETLQRCAGALAWAWLADTLTVQGDSVTVRLAGNKPIAGALPDCPPADAGASVGLWEWTTAAPQPARRSAVAQAVSLQSDVPSDLYRRAQSIHDTAQFLYALSQSTLVQEALAARRAARDAAVAAGRSAADRARSAARAAVDRVLVVIAAGVGVVLANKGDLINESVALGLIGLAAALTLGAALIAFHLDLPGAARVVKVFRSETEVTAEVLSPRDIEAINSLPSLDDGVAEVKRARRAAFAIVVVAAAALAGLAIAVAGTSISPKGTPQSPTPSTSDPATTTSIVIATTSTTPPSSQP